MKIRACRKISRELRQLGFRVKRLSYRDESMKFVSPIDLYEAVNGLVSLPIKWEQLGQNFDGLTDMA